jgi:hypothetical protein
VPLDQEGQAAEGGLLRWFWPWGYRDGGPLGQITPAAGFPIAGFFLAARHLLVLGWPVVTDTVATRGHQGAVGW